MVLVRRGDDAERVPRAAVGQAGVVRVDERRRDAASRSRAGSRPRARSSCRRSRRRRRRLRAARKPTRPSSSPAFGAAVEVRHVAGEPEQLQLEREPERIEAGLADARAGSASSRSRKRVSAANARSFASCSVKSRSIASAPTSPTASLYGSSRVSRWEERGRPRSPSAARRSPGAASARRATAARAWRRSATSSSARPLRPRRRDRGRPCRRAGRDRPRRTGTSAARRPQSCTSGPSSECRAATRRELTAAHLRCTPDEQIQIYTTRWCGYCVRAKALLDGKGLPYEEILLDDDPDFRRTLHELTGGWTVPQILIDGTPIGGYAELWRLDKSGQLDSGLAA